MKGETMRFNDYPVVIFCGGLGTRLGEITNGTVPKPMVFIDRFPILAHIIESYYSQGFRRFILCTGHLDYKIKEYFLNYEFFRQDVEITRSANTIGTAISENRDINIKILFTGENTMTAGRLSRIREYLQDDIFYLTYGDGLANVNHQLVYQKLIESNTLCTITGIYQDGRFGDLEVKDSLVKKFDEKPEGAQLINGGFMCLRTEFLDRYAEFCTDDMMLEGQPLRQCAKDLKLALHYHDGFWQCMDGPRDYRVLSEITRTERKLPWIL
jgi:glucose-1-phosphate cytidylyltransferase